MPRFAGNRVAVDRALAQNVEDDGQHQQRENGEASALVGENHEHDILEHDQHAEEAENQQVQNVMYAADALLLLAVVGVDVGAPVGGEARLNGRDQLCKAVPEGKQALRILAAGVAHKGKADTAGQAEQDLRRGQCHAVGHSLAGNAAQLAGGQRRKHSAAVLVPECNGNHAKA